MDGGGGTKKQATAETILEWKSSADNASGMALQVQLASTTRLFVVMGVASSGKSTVAAMLAQSCGGEFLDADVFHPPENIAKMQSGNPLNDADRAGWLDRLNLELRRRAGQSRPVFLACSALKQNYRKKISVGLAVNWIYLRISREAACRRMEQRANHFMPATLVDSQFAALEEPSEALILDAEQPAARLAALVQKAFADLPWKPSRPFDVCSA